MVVMFSNRPRLGAPARLYWGSLERRETVLSVGAVALDDEARPALVADLGRRVTIVAEQGFQRTDVKARRRDRVSHRDEVDGYTYGPRRAGTNQYGRCRGNEAQKDQLLFHGRPRFLLLIEWKPAKKSLIFDVQNHPRF